MGTTRFTLARRAFILKDEIPFEIFRRPWDIIPGKTLNILIWIRAAPEQENWLELLMQDEPVTFYGRKRGTLDQTIKCAVTAQRKIIKKLGHGKVWEVSFTQLPI